MKIEQSRKGADPTGQYTIGLALLAGLLVLPAVMHVLAIVLA